MLSWFYYKQFIGKCENSSIFTSHCLSAGVYEVFVYNLFKQILYSSEPEMNRLLSKLFERNRQYKRNFFSPLCLSNTALLNFR